MILRRSAKGSKNEIQNKSSCKNLSDYIFAVIALFTASAVTAAKGVLLPLAIGEAALSVVLAVSAILKMHNEFRIIKNAVISLNASLSDKDMLKYFPLPAVICKANGKILWFNDLFKAAVIRNRQPREDNISVFIGGKALSELAAKKHFQRLMTVEITPL